MKCYFKGKSVLRIACFWENFMCLIILIFLNSGFIDMGRGDCPYWLYWLCFFKISCCVADWYKNVFFQILVCCAYIKYSDFKEDSGLLSDIIKIKIWNICLSKYSDSNTFGKMIGWPLGNYETHLWFKCNFLV